MITAKLLDNAYLQIDLGDCQSAINILDSLVSTDPGNVEAWEAYMQICKTGEELDGLCERVLQIAVISHLDRESILDYYYYLRQKLGSKVFDIEFQNEVSLELMNQFDLAMDVQLSVFAKSGWHTKIILGLNKLLASTMIAFRFILLAMGSNLILVGNNFGYWILSVLALNILVGLWEREIYLIFRSNQIHSRCQSAGADFRRDEISYHPELIS